MIDKKTFCENCRKDVLFETFFEEMESDLKGDKYKYKGQKAICKECKNEIYVPEILSYNLNALYDKFREENGIIQRNAIIEIPDKYKISRRNLSLLLGWGEITFDRYFNGNIPSRQYSDQLKRIYEDPNYFMEMLDKNKGKLKGESAYQKSKDAVEMLLNPKNDKSKIKDIASYIISKCELTPLSLQKILYYVQGFFYAFTQLFLFEDDCEAWLYGPVYKDIYFTYKQNGRELIKGEPKDCDWKYSTFEKQVVDNVIRSFCCYSGEILIEFTHSEIPWLKARGNLPSSEKSSNIINKDSIGCYFMEVKEKYNMISPTDIRSYSRDKFEHINWPC